MTSEKSVELHEAVVTDRRSQDGIVMLAIDQDVLTMCRIDYFSDATVHR